MRELAAALLVVTLAVAGAAPAAEPATTVGPADPAKASDTRPAEPAGDHGVATATPPEGAPVPAAAERTRSRGSRTFEVLRGDYGEFYSARGLGRLSAGLFAAGAIANTDADQEAYDWYHGEVGEGADSFADGADQLGEPAVGLAGAALGVALLGLVPEGDGENAAAAWVRRTARGYVVGLPAMYYLQQLVGSGRPDEPEGSRWQAFGETHGVSGHAFLAAVPLLTLARSSDNRAVQGTAFVASLATAWARVHQGEHYPSQAFLGWYLAWTATGAVARSDAGRPQPRWAVVPTAAPDGGGLLVHASF